MVEGKSFCCQFDGQISIQWSLVVKTQPRHYRLRDSIRNCFPPQVRERVAINPITVCRNDEAAMTIVRVELDDEASHCNTDALLALLEADTIEHRRDRAVIQGCFAGRRCEIQLVTLSTFLPA